MKQTTDTTKKAIIAALIGNTMWGFSFMASKVGLSTAPVILLLSHRFLLAFLVMSLLRLTPLGMDHLDSVLRDFRQRKLIDFLR